MSTLPLKAKAYATTIIILGSAVLAVSLRGWRLNGLAQFLAYFALVLLGSRLKVGLPGVTGTLSANFIFILIGIAELNLPQTILMGCSGALLQCVWKAKKRPQPVQIVFNLASMAIAIATADYIYHRLCTSALGLHAALAITVSAGILFVANTLQVSVIISLTEGKRVWQIWHDVYFWSFPYYLLGGGVAAAISAVNRHIGWQASFLLIPIVYSVYRTYFVYLARLEDEKKHAEQVAALHLRTIEALALAIEPKDHTTHLHLQRVSTYAREVGKELRLSETELAALRAAALLHDIGKLGVPENILSKPGKLTPEEFERMKSHPLVGAEIVERVQFPYAVAPIVRAHHERWDGKGYPGGLKGEEIPIGARILAAVDCLDALTSDRQYRRAYSLSEAIEVVQNESGKAYDPRVVEILSRRYQELDEIVRKEGVALDPGPSKGVNVRNETHPAAGYEASEPNAAADSAGFLTSIAAAREEAQMLFELSQSLGSSLSLDDTLSVLGGRLQRSIPHDAVAVYIRKDDWLVPEYVHGEDFRQLSSLRIPIGQGLAGWVAQNRKPIVNGNPSVEPGYAVDPCTPSSLQSALAVPLEGIEQVMGVLVLYQRQKDAFSRDHLRILLAISSKLGFSIQNVLKYRMAENSATTDYLTGLPNARSLFLRLDSELARAKRSHNSLTVFVCDLNGFKQVNDRFGHLAGNKVLESVASRLKESCREYDSVARMGGDEFVVIMPGAEPGTVRERLRQLRSIATEVGHQICGEPLLSLSVGEASYPSDGNNAEQLLAEADRKMYRAKQQHYALKQLDLQTWELTAPAATVQ